MQIFVTNKAFNTFKIEHENRDFLTDFLTEEKKKKKKRAASGCWHYIESAP